MKINDYIYYLYIRLTQPGKILPGLILLAFLSSLLWGFHAAAQVSGSVFFSIGKGYTDGIPRQLVRTNQDRLYIFSPNAQHTNIINVYWTEVAGLPSSADSFTGFTTLTETGNPLSVDAVYDGNSIIHVLINTENGSLKDHPFDLTTNTFRSPITLADDTPTITTNYIGTVGVSGMVDSNGNLHIAYWSNGEHITYQAYSYNAGTSALTPVGSKTQVDTNGNANANHPALAVSPLDSSITVAWISEAETTQVLARTRSSSGIWSGVETVSSAIPWTSRNEGVNIDQGPNMLITPDGTRHLLYIENWDTTNQYGSVHYAVKSGTVWTDTELDFYSHNPGLATNLAGDIYLIGHGKVSTGENVNMYVLKKNSNGSWGTPQLFAAPPIGTGENFDASPSIKWSVVGFNRPETVEFVFFTPIGGNYNNTNIYYGRFSIGGGVPPTSPPYAKPVVPFFRDRTPTLTWSAISWAQGYQIELDDDPTFASSTIANIPAGTLSYTTTQLSNKTYYWRVHAKKNDSEWGNWSATQTFVVSAP